MSYKQKIQAEIIKAINNKVENVVLERTKTKEHGDIATNIAMIIAKEQKANPFNIANEIKEKIKANEDLISHIEVAKPGFINFVVGDFALSESLSEIISLGESYGFAPKKPKDKMLIEYVSANPTGDLHIGHGRQAVIGSCLANLLKAAGHDIWEEFYINDFGEQIQKLTDTAWAIYEKSLGKSINWSEDYYPEENILSYVTEIIKQKNNTFTKDELGLKVKDLIIKVQKELLSSFGIVFDRWFSETDLHKNDKVNDVLKMLLDKNYAYKHEGATWFKSKEFNESRDRVLVRTDGRFTYLLADIAYHIDKLSRSDHLITIWGADHHGQEISLKGGLKALGYNDSNIEIIFVQLVSLKKEGQEVKMSKRAGTVVTISDVLNEVGADAFRYFLVESHPNNRMVFDIDLAKKQDKDNPVYYIQYAHARCCSIFRQANESGILKQKSSASQQNPEIFMNLFRTNNQEYDTTKTLVLRILDFPEEVLQAAKSRAPNRIANYLKDLATDFHQFYTVCRVISKEPDLTTARLELVKAVKITIANGLKILGISAPEAM